MVHESTFRTWISDHDFDADMAEIALSAKFGTKVQQAYDRADMIEKRRRNDAKLKRF
jgi:hypothetical protein